MSVDFSDMCPLEIFRRAVRFRCFTMRRHHRKSCFGVHSSHLLGDENGSGNRNGACEDNEEGKFLTFVIGMQYKETSTKIYTPF